MTRIGTILLAVALACLPVRPALATAQQADALLLDGKEHALNTNPLAAWIEAHPDRAPGSEVRSSANWRGYIATWEIAGGKLWLRKVEVSYVDGKERREYVDNKGVGRVIEIPQYRQRDVLGDLFDGRREIVATWYTGTLIVPQGELVDYVHMGYGSTYERYTIIWVKAGEVLRRLDLDAEQYTALRKERFEAYKQTAAYREQVGRLKGKDAAFREDFLYQFATEEYLSADPALAK